jgi:hypothetical protein
MLKQLQLVVIAAVAFTPNERQALTFLLCCFVYRLVQCLCSAAITAPLLQQQSLWLGLLHEMLLRSPGHAGLAALQLPLVAAGSDIDAAATGAAGAGSAEAAVLLQMWQAVGSWTAMPGVRGKSAGRDHHQQQQHQQCMCCLQHAVA